MLRHGRVALTARVDAAHAMNQLGYMPQAVAHDEGTEVLVVGYGAQAGALLESFAEELVVLCDGVELSETCRMDAGADVYRVLSTG